MNKRYYVPFAAIAVTTLVCLTTPQAIPAAGSNKLSAYSAPVKSLVVETEFFTIKSRYHPTEGPGFFLNVKVNDLIHSKHIVLPKSMMQMEDSSAHGHTHAAAKKDQPAHPIGLVKLGRQPPKLYWFMGARLDVIDKNGTPAPEFLCHSAISMDVPRHNREFPQATPTNNRLLALFTQGITNIQLPAGFGVPVCSNEKFRFILKALNQTTNQPRQIKLRCTAYLVADEDLHTPMAALNTYRADIKVLLADAASSQKQIKDSLGWDGCHLGTGIDPPHDIYHCAYHHKFSQTGEGHNITEFWVIPPGHHSYRAPIPHSFAYSGPIHAVVCHLHPFCEKLSLVEFDKGNTEKKLFTVHCRTSAAQGIRLLNIDYLTSNKGIALKKDARYGLEVTYNNTSGKNQDSMAVVIMYVSDLNFKKPLWATASRLAQAS